MLPSVYLFVGIVDLLGFLWRIAFRW